MTLLFLLTLPSGCSELNLRGFEPSFCFALQKEEFGRFLDALETTKIHAQLPGDEGDAGQTVEIRRVLSLAGDLQISNDATNKHQHLFLPADHECQAVSYSVLVEITQSMQPCILEVTQTSTSNALHMPICKNSNNRAFRGDLVSCWKIQACGVDFESLQLASLVTQFPQVRLSESISSAALLEEVPPAPVEPLASVEVKKAPKNKADIALEGGAEGSFGKMSDDVSPADLPKIYRDGLPGLLDKSATRLLLAYQYSEHDNSANLFRKLYPSAAADFGPKATIRMHELVTWLENNALRRIVSSRDLRFGDLVVRMRYDERNMRSGGQPNLIRDNPYLREKTTADYIGLYVGRGLVAVPFIRRGADCDITMVPLVEGYVGAYRLVSGFAMAEYRLPTDILEKFGGSCLYRTHKISQES